MDETPGTGHAGWFDDAERIIEAVRTAKGLPLPFISPDRAAFYLTAIVHPEDTREALDRAEAILAAALDLTFTPRRTQSGSTRNYILTALLPSGLLVDIVANGRHIEDRDEIPALTAVA